MNPFPKPPTQSDLTPQQQHQQLLNLLQSNPQLLQKYQQQLSKFQAQNKSAAHHPPMTSKEYLQKLGSIEKYLDSEGGIVIEPTPSFVIKFMEKRTHQKIFVNVVTHEVIDHPEEKLLVDFENQPGLRIPMSMGKVREDHDKNGNVCKVVDVVLNPKIVQTAQTSPDILSFTAQIIGNYLLQKHKIAVADDVLKKVKGLKYKGNKVQIQRVKGRKAPKIEQLSQQETKLKKMKQQKQQQLLNEINDQTLNKNIMRPQFQILAYTQNEGISKYQPYSLQVKQYTHLKIVINLPHLIHSKGIHLEGSQRLIYLSVRNMYELCLKMPFDVKNFKTQFSRKQRKLQIFVYRTQKNVEQTKNQQVQNKKQIQAKNNTEKQQKPVKEVKNNQQQTIITLDNDLLYDLV